MSDGGKGSSPRPYSVSNEEYANRWDAIFGRDIKKDQEKALNNLVRNAEELGLYDKPENRFNVNRKPKKYV